MSRSRIIAYDALRVFAIVSVVAIHALMPYRTTAPPHAPVRLLDDLLHYAVPLFVVISGVFVWGRTPSASMAEDWRATVRRTGSLVAPYLAWSALYVALLVAGGRAPGPGRLAGLILVGNVWYHLYFIPMLASFYLLTPLAVRIAARAPGLMVVGAYAIRLLLGPLLVSGFERVLGDLGWAYMTHVVIHLPHMALGAWFALRHEANWPWLRRAFPFMLGAGTAMLLAVSLGMTAEWPDLARRAFQPAGMALTIVGVTAGALALEPWLERSSRASRIVAWSAPLALGVYYIHPALLAGLAAGLAPTVAGVGADRHPLWQQAWFPVTVWVAVCALSFAASAILASLPSTRWLVGARRGSRRGGRDTV